MLDAAKSLLLECGYQLPIAQQYRGHIPMIGVDAQDERCASTIHVEFRMFRWRDYATAVTDVDTSRRYSPASHRHDLLNERQAFDHERNNSFVPGMHAIVLA